MSRPSRQKSGSGSQDPSVTKEELQERWKRLELKPATLLHLQEALDTSGIQAAMIATEIVEREKRSHIAAAGKEWGWQELRLLTLQGVRPHLLNMFRFVIEVLAAWHLISPPEESLAGMIEAILAALFLAAGLIAIHLVSWLRGKTQRSRRHIAA